MLGVGEASGMFPIDTESMTYRQDLVEQSMKFSAVAHPGLPGDVLRRTRDSMPMEDLIDFCNAFQAKAASVLPIHSQFSQSPHAADQKGLSPFQI